MKNLIRIAAMISTMLSPMTGQVGDNSAGSVTSITLERTACYRRCPSYRVTIYEDGGIVFEGRAGVACMGIQRGNVPVEAFKQLEERILDMHFGSLEEKYGHDLQPGDPSFSTDQARRIVTVSFRGGSATVCDLADAPASLTALQNEIDRVCGTKRWIESDQRPR